MDVILFQAIGAVAFLVVTIVIGQRIRSDTSKDNGEKLSRISHALFWGGLVLPELVGVVYPGLRHFDQRLGLSPLPGGGIREALGWLMVVGGLYYLVASNHALKSLGSGFAAFKLTRHVVSKSVYDKVRNPMSLGTYLAYVGISLSFGSTYLLLGALFVVIPVHLFNLIFFEEVELRARYGESYERYRERVPFIIPCRCGAEPA